MLDTVQLCMGEAWPYMWTCETFLDYRSEHEGRRHYTTCKIWAGRKQAMIGEEGGTMAE